MEKVTFRSCSMSDTGTPTSEELWDSLQKRFLCNIKGAEMISGVVIMENDNGSDERPSDLSNTGALSNDGMQSALTDEYCDQIIDEAYTEINGQDDDGLQGFCIGCGCAKATFLLFTEDERCCHLVYCDKCVEANILQMGMAGVSLPAHLWSDICQIYAKCPICRMDGKLVRIWRPEEAGGRNGMCLVCGVREARDMVLPCRHLCCCGDCEEKLIVGMNSSGHPIIECPACHSEGHIQKVYVP